MGGASLDNRGSGAGSGFPVSSYSPALGYTPKVTNVGNPAQKVFMADSGRRGIPSATPTINTRAAQFSGPSSWAFGSAGPCFTQDQGFNRDSAPGNPLYNTGTPYDGRQWGFRHGTGSKGSVANSYRFNLAFFDGHVETRSDLDGSDPSMWMPTNSTWNPAAGSGYIKAQPDVIAKYLGGSTAMMTVN